LKRLRINQNIPTFGKGKSPIDLPPGIAKTTSEAYNQNIPTFGKGKSPIDLPPGIAKTTSEAYNQN